MTCPRSRRVVLLVLLAFSSSIGSPRSASAQPRIAHGPYLQHPTATSMTIVWHTNRPSVSRVEYGVGDDLDMTAVSSHYGLIDNQRTSHMIRLTALKPGTTYHYRAVSTEFLGYVRQHIASFGDSVMSPVDSFTTLDPAKEAFSFSFVSDIHERAEDLAARISGPAWKGIDFAFFGGDMINDFMEPDQMFDGFIDVSVEGFAREIPFIFARGNHETRGRYARDIFDYIATVDSRSYFSFDQGPVHFVVLDSGEDKEDGHEYYNGLVDFDRFREEQARWLEEEVRSEAWRDARFRIVVTHIPPRGGNGYAIQQVRERFEGVLKGAGVDLWLSGHNHEYLHLERGTEGMDYDLVVDDDHTSLRVDVDLAGLTVTVFGADGNAVDAFSLERG